MYQTIIYKINFDTWLAKSNNFVSYSKARIELSKGIYFGSLYLIV